MLQRPVLRRIALSRGFVSYAVRFKPRPSPASSATMQRIVSRPSASNPQMSFPCLDRLEQKSQTLLNEGPEPAYAKIGQQNVHIFRSKEPIYLDYGGFLPEFEIAYETWGELNEKKDNCILVHTGLSASSHAKSSDVNPKRGWWEDFIGPGRYLDTNKYFVVCTNVIGGCYGSTGPSSVDPADGKRYATRFPILSVNDMVRAQHRLISRHFGVQKLYCSMGASMGGMQSLAYAHEFTDEVEKVISISGCAKSHPYSIAMRHCQRQVLMSDPNWNRGFYYDSLPPHTGMKLSREIATVTYRSGPEWETRFGTERADPSKQPALCPDFLIETYLDHQGEKFCLEYDANSLLYISKAMDLFNLSKSARDAAAKTRMESVDKIANGNGQFQSECALPEKPYMEKPRKRLVSFEDEKEDLKQGLAKFAHKDVLVIGVESDILFPVWQQREISQFLKESAKRLGISNGQNIRHVELGEDVSMYGHDTFLLSLDHIGQPVSDFLG